MTKPTEYVSDNLLLRKLLWLRHGCPFHCLYGDDGEMQCSCCMLDFLRDSPQKIEERFIEINQPKLAEFLKAIKSNTPIPKPEGEER